MGPGDLLRVLEINRVVDVILLVNRRRLDFQSHFKLRHALRLNPKTPKSNRRRRDG
jgi:hypothetical protein